MAPPPRFPQSTSCDGPDRKRLLSRRARTNLSPRRPRGVREELRAESSKQGTVAASCQVPLLVVIIVVVVRQLAFWRTLNVFSWVLEKTSLSQTITNRLTLQIIDHWNDTHIFWNVYFTRTLKSNQDRTKQRCHESDGTSLHHKHSKPVRCLPSQWVEFGDSEASVCFDFVCNDVWRESPPFF